MLAGLGVDWRRSASIGRGNQLQVASPRQPRRHAKGPVSFDLFFIPLIGRSIEAQFFKACSLEPSAHLNAARVIVLFSYRTDQLG